jgi:hypothetical protein
VVVAALPAMLFAVQGDPRDFAHLRRLNFGLAQECEVLGSFTVRTACRTSDRPRLLVWGDSFAEHIVPGIAASTSVGIEQATSSGCGPFPGLAPSGFGPPCLAFNASVLAHLAATPSIEVVVLASSYGSYLSGAPLLSKEGEGIRTVTPTPELAFEVLRATVDRLHASTSALCSSSRRPATSVSPSPAARNGA